MQKKGFTFLELIITVSLTAILFLVSAFLLKAFLLNWSSQETRAGEDIVLERALEKIARDVRAAKEIQSTANFDEVRFTQNQSTYYIYYLYNVNDRYTPWPQFNQTTYQLKKAVLSGGSLSGTFTYGAGDLILNNVLPPPASDISLTNNLLTLNLSVRRKGETLRSKTKVQPRNL